MRFILVVFFLALTSVAVYGWGKDGHKIVAQIAADQLNPTATNIVSQFIGSRTLADIAPIPDLYDATSEGKWSKPCHYVNMNRGQTNFSMSVDCTGFCVVKSIQNYTQILQQTQANPSECSFEKGDEPCALIFLVHFVGDVHQPLHVGYADDEGGNEIEVYWMKEDHKDNVTLHNVWDDQIIDYWNDDWSDAASDLEDMMSQETSTVKKYRAETDPIVWADESFYWVRETVYNFSSDSEFKFKNVLHKPGKVTINDYFQAEPLLGEWYYNQNLPVVQQRLIAAGVRLGALLNAILTGN
eukprot:TRINITY_DN706_c0_g1_i1.p1 TRINITY_DN706_c0_g1~~TRINITY_DN706_c0_g1_i1.p1  ORF type:complete len:298 (-),score=74.90 TRINITY_DN706_c0_g1_i1:587-1480(-)